MPPPSPCPGTPRDWLAEAERIRNARTLPRPDRAGDTGALRRGREDRPRRRVLDSIACPLTP